MKYKIAYTEIELQDSDIAIRTPEDVIRACSTDHAHELQESLYVYGLDNGNRVRFQYLVARGGSNRMMITPADIITPLLHNGCRNAIIVHNHPSGSIEPSEEDIVFTRKIVSAFKIVGMSLLDHMIISGDRFFSFRREALI